MSPIHISPEEAVKAHLEIESDFSIAMHFGTFQLADDGKDQPIDDLKMAIQKYDLRDEQFIVLEEGMDFSLDISTSE